MALLHNLLDAPDLPGLQTDLDAVRVRGRVGQDILDHTPGQFAGGLVLLEHDQNGHARLDIGAMRGIEHSGP